MKLVLIIRLHYIHYQLQVMCCFLHSPQVKMAMQTERPTAWTGRRNTK